MTAAGSAVAFGGLTVIVTPGLVCVTVVRTVLGAGVLGTVVGTVLGAGVLGAGALDAGMLDAGPLVVAVLDDAVLGAGVPGAGVLGAGVLGAAGVEVHPASNTAIRQIPAMMRDDATTVPLQDSCADRSPGFRADPSQARVNGTP